MEGNRNPELQRVLAALNSYSQQQQPGQQYATNIPQYANNHVSQSIFPSDSSSVATSSIPGLGLFPQAATYNRPITPPSINRQQSYAATQIQQHSTASKLRIPAEALRSRSSTPKYDTPDASNITSWPAALKHVTRHLASNDKVATRVKHLINEQHKHEREWWAGREAIAERHQGRPGTSQQVLAILQSLGANVPRSPDRASLPDAEQKKANEAELKAYDEKVYKALCAMAADFDRQLREMGVPFYAIKHDLVILKERPEKTPGEHKGKVDKGELRELQKKMCETLEDLFGDAE